MSARALKRDLLLEKQESQKKWDGDGVDGTTAEADVINLTTCNNIVWSLYSSTKNTPN